jgi:hypothetical protein
MDQDKLRQIYDEKYQKLLLMDFNEWMDQAPQTQDQAYEILEEIDQELKATQDEYDQAQGDAKWEIGEYREMLHNKYQLIEEMFSLESQDE